MNLKIVGAGLPRTGTSSLRKALEHLLDGPVCHMSALPGHPFNLGEGWQRAIAGKPTDWDQVMEGYVASVDWPASMFWRELSERNPDSLVLLSVRGSAEEWWESVNATITRHSRRAMAPDWNEGRDLLDLLERFTGTEQWDDPETMMAAYERHNAEVQETVPADRFLEWRAQDGWEPICRALDLPVPDFPFPWTNRRGEWK